MVTATEVEKETEAIPSVKDLASSDASLRRKNLQQILTHLESRPSSQRLTHTQALQLWRGFHVALYMHDSKNQLSVQTLIATLASTFEVIRSKDIEVSAVPTKTGSKTDPNGNQNDEDEFNGFDDDETSNDSSWLATYSTAFWETIAREWSGVDQWRLNKYLSLVRFATREILKISLLAYYGLEDNNPPNPPVSTNTTPRSKKRKEANNPETNTAKKAKTTTTNTSVIPSSNRISTPSKPTATTQLTLLATNALSPRARTTPDGLRLHMLDIYTDELLTAVSTLRSKSTTTPDSLTTVLREEFMRPVKTISVDGLSRHVRVRAKEVLGEFEERIRQV